MIPICSHRWYKFLCVFARSVLRILHPVIRVEGAENLPEGAAVLCANHSGILDPVWVVAWSRLERHPRIMAKKELFRKKFLSYFFYKIGAFPVDRQGSDIAAIKTAFQTLKDDNKLLIFPEGTRIRKGKVSRAHSGATLIASRMHAPIVPIYLSSKRFLFSPVRLVIGKPYYLEFAVAKPTAEELQDRADTLMKQIYDMGEKR